MTWLLSLCFHDMGDPAGAAKSALQKLKKKDGTLMLVDDMGNAFNIESVQSPLNLAYQYAFTGNMSEAMSELQIASNELDSLIINLTRAGQQMTAISENRTIFADNDTRQMMSGLGDALTQLGVSANELKQNLPIH